MGRNLLSSESKQVLKLALPLAGSQLISTIMGFVGIVLLSRYNSESLAASALISSTQMVILLFGMGILFSTSILVGHSFGAKQYSNIGKILTQAIGLALLISLPLIAITCFIGNVLKFLEQPTSLIVVVSYYFKILAFGIPAFLMLTALQQTLFSIHKQSIALAADFVSLILTIVLGFGLIYGKFGFPELGVAGLAYATVIRAWITVFALICYLTLNPSNKEFRFFSSFAFDKSICMTLFNIGWPISINITGEILSLFVTTIMVGWLGIEALNAQQISMQYLLILVVPLFGISQAISILSSHLIGANQLSMLRPFGLCSIKLGYLFTLIALIICIIFPKLLLSAFINTNDVGNILLIKLTSLLLIIIVIGQFFDSLRNVCAGALRGLKITKTPMFISLGYIWLFSIPFGYILGFNFNLGLPGIAIAHDIGMLFAGISLYRLWLRSITNQEAISSSQFETI